MRASSPAFSTTKSSSFSNDLAGDISFALDYILQEERLAYVSYYDTLTGLPNRQLFFDRLAQSLHAPAPRAEQRHLAIMIIDLQRFKTVNDTLGRHAGDRVLKDLANRLQRIRRGINHARARCGRPLRRGRPHVPVCPRWIEEWVIRIVRGPAPSSTISSYCHLPYGEGRHCPPSVAGLATAPRPCS